MCVFHEAPPYLEFVYVPLLEASGVAHIFPPWVKSPTSFAKGHLFDSLEDMLVLSMVFT